MSPSPASCEAPLYLGIDLGTSGCRAIAIDREGRIQADASTSLPQAQQQATSVEQQPAHWWQAVTQVLAELLQKVPAGAVQAIAVDGTSATVCLLDATGKPLSPGLMYNDTRAAAEATLLQRHAPPDSPVHSAGSGLAKLLWLRQHAPRAPAPRWLAHQADFISARLSGRYGHSDANNCLKTGYDLIRQCWPNWLEALDIEPSWLPQVHAPGTPLGPVSGPIARQFGLAPDTQVITGTTDSTAAFLATGASAPGEAVTSLGSTLVLKVIADRPVTDSQLGVYSQPLPRIVHPLAAATKPDGKSGQEDRWLVGGASNSGGAVLRHYFSDAEMQAMENRLDPEHSLGLDYYPLLQAGERFPVNDPALLPCLSPIPEEPLQFFQGLLEGIARIEVQGYRCLATLGAPWPSCVRSVGGGARNSAWTQIRARLLGVPLIPALQTEAAYGAALLARAGSNTC